MPKFIPILIILLIFAPSAFAQSAEPLTPTVVELSHSDDNPVLGPGARGEWDAVSVRFPNVIFHDDQFHMFYGTFQDRMTPVAIGYATSQDGINWTKFDENPVFEADGEGFDAFGVTSPLPFVDEDGEWTLYYNGLALEGQVFGQGIGRATAPSPEGPWTRAEDPVLQNGESGAWDSGFLFPDSILASEDGYRLYYSSGSRIGLATSEDGVAWAKYDDPATDGRFAASDPVFEPTSGWESDLSWAGDVHALGDGFEMFYYGASQANPISIGYAYSTDGIKWTRFEENPMLSGPGGKTVFFPSVVINDQGGYMIFYATTDPGGGSFTEFGLATGSITRGE